MESPKLAIEGSTEIVETRTTAANIVFLDQRIDETARSASKTGTEDRIRYRIRVTHCANPAPTAQKEQVLQELLFLCGDDTEYIGYVPRMHRRHTIASIREFLAEPDVCCNSPSSGCRIEWLWMVIGGIFRYIKD